MSEVPDPLLPLSILLDAIIMAHTAIYALHRRLVSLDRSSRASQDLLAQSVEIALHNTPQATVDVRRLASQWHEQSVLDPAAAEAIAQQLEKQLVDVESVLRQLLARESDIAAELRALIEEAR